MIVEKKIEDILQQLPGTSYGHALTEVLNQWEEEMNDVSTILIIEQLEGRKIALKLIKDLFKFMGERSKVITKKNQYT